MKRRSLLVVVALLCVASLMAAMAYSRATVTSGASFRISNTKASLLALEASEFHKAAGYRKVGTNNILSINWAAGHDDGSYGFQYDSVYEWDDLFKVTNNSEKTVEVTLSVPLDTRYQGEYGNKYTSNIMGILSLRKDNADAWQSVADYKNGADGTLTFTLAAGASVWIDSQFDYTQTKNVENSKFDIELVVDAVVVK